MPNPNIHPDSLRTNLRGLTLAILRRHVARFFALKRRGNPAVLCFAHERLRLMVEPSSVVARLLMLKQEPPCQQTGRHGASEGQCGMVVAWTMSGQVRGYAAIGRVVNGLPV
jgi:hypothetical protein